MVAPNTDMLLQAETPVSLRAETQTAQKRLQRLAIGCAIILGLLTAWETLTTLVAFTDDAYVRSDLVAIAPQKGGTIVTVRVTDNQPVRRGDLLAVIDRVPFQLAADEHQAALRAAKARAAADQADIAQARDQLNSAAATLQYAIGEQRRTAALVGGNTVSRQQFDQANEALQRAQAQQQAAHSAIDKASSSLAMDEAEAARSEAQLAFAVWQLGQTEIRAPVDGTVNNLTLRVGDTAQVGTPLIGVIDSAAWRIVANYKQVYIQRIHAGDIAWVWLDTHPWRFYRARVQGVARGISRQQTAGELLPYVAPTTDWIRLQHRFPVTLDLVDPPSDLTLYMGADASVLMFR